MGIRVGGHEEGGNKGDRLGLPKRGKRKGEVRVK
jgi:hypothetical protein